MDVLSSIVVFVLINYFALSDCQNNFKDVLTDQGTVRGYNVDEDDVFSFYGIPYATAPTASKDRFKAALPAPNWADVFEATTKNVICPQRPAYADTDIELIRTVDCLRLNIFVPDTEETDLPVYIYIHGGEFQQGYALEVSPVAIVQRGIIAVSVSYRIGVHGFLCLGTEFAPGNAGMKDQIAAFKWVQRNIAHFGGNPNNVAIGGLSAGSSAVELNILSPMANGLFHKAVSESGAGYTNGSMVADPIKVAEEFANEFGVYTNQDIDALEIFFESLADEELSVLSNSSNFLLCVEDHNITIVEKFLSELPNDIITNGNYETRPYLTGYTGMEILTILSTYDTIKLQMEDNFQSVLPENLVFQSTEQRLEAAQRLKDVYFPTGEITQIGVVDYYSDTIITYAVISSARYHTQHLATTYLYAFNYNGSLNLPVFYGLPIWGPGHIAQSFYIQHGYYNGMYDNMSENDLLTQERLREMWVNFIKYGDPTYVQSEYVNLTWLPATSEVLNYLNIDLELSMEQSPLQNRVALWDELYGVFIPKLRCDGR